jgi:serine phosphatase RsbU (regulator of sigma subunit)
MNPDERSPFRILVADDDPMSRRTLVRALEADYDVVECRSGLEAIQTLEGNGAALVVLDYQMPDLNGAEVCELIRSSCSPEVAQSPIIMLTGQSNAGHEIECLRAGADDFVTKPVNLAVLRARLDTHLRLHAMRNQLLAQNVELENWRRLQEQDLEAARLTQRAILPARPPALDGWTFASQYHPLMQIGGDIYDWVRTPDGSLLVWISDATGHGASAALLTTLSKVLFRHAFTECHAAACLMDYVEREFQAVFKGRSFMAAGCLQLWPGNGRALFCGAGIPPLLVLRRDGRVEAIRSTRPPLGLNKTALSAAEKCELAEGEAILLYTDGLYEVRNAEGERLGLDALERSLPPLDGATSEDWLARVIRKAREHGGDAPITDDIAAFAAVYGKV